MKNRWFYPGLFRDSLRQLRAIGVTALILLGIGAFCVTVSQWMTRPVAIPGARETGLNITRSLLSGMDIVPLLLLVPSVMAPVMTLSVFSYLNKRNRSDFYHALPCRRQALFLSQLAAVAVWVTVVIVLYTAASVLMMLCLSRWYVIHIFGVMVMAFNCWAASLLVISGVALAMSVTGTLLTNLVASVLVLFAPRIFLLVIVHFLSLPTVLPDYLFGVLSPSYNLVSNFLVSLFYGIQPRVIDFLPGGLYTLFLAVVHGGLALWAFCRRRSESAEQAAGRPAQTVCRLALTGLICLIPCGTILFCIREKTANSYSVFGIVVVYIVALIVYFLYELITTKKKNNLLRAIPMLGVLVALNLAVIGGVFGVEQALLHWDIAPSQVASINLRVEGMNGMSEAEGVWESGNSYFGRKEKEIDYTESSLIALLADGFTENNRLLRQSQKKYEAIQKVYTGHVVRFNLKNGLSVYRSVYLNPEDEAALIDTLLQNEALHQTYLSLPDVDGVGNTCDVYGLSASRSRELFAVMQEEISTLDFDVWYRFLMDGDETVDRIGTWVSLNYTWGVNHATLTIPLSSRVLPRSVTAYLALYQQENPRIAENLAAAFREQAMFMQEQAWDDNDGMLDYLELEILPVLRKAETAIYTISVWEEGEEEKKYDMEALADWLDQVAQTPATQSDALYHIVLRTGRSDQNYTMEAYVAMPNGTVDPLLSCMEFLL